MSEASDFSLSFEIVQNITVCEYFSKFLKHSRIEYVAVEFGVFAEIIFG